MGEASEALAALIRRQRERVPYSQAELAERAGVSRRALVDHEAGRRIPHPSALRGYARVLGIEPETFMRLARSAHEQRDREHRDAS